MAANSVITKNSLVLKYQNGVDDKGNPKFTTQKFSRIKLQGTDEAMKNVGTALGALLFSDNTQVLKEQDFIIE